MARRPGGRGARFPGAAARSARRAEDCALEPSGSVACVPVADSAFVRACRCQPVDRVPVWFMRQAGRSLPEYRAARGTGSILDAIRQPELAAELTLQPVRRYGVDAAILFSDIVVPAAAVGFGVEVEQGRGPVVAQPFRSARGPGPAPASGARGRHRLRARGRPPGHERSSTRSASRSSASPGRRSRWRAIWSKGGPSRVYAHTKALMRGDPDLFALLLDVAGRHGPGVAAGPGRGRVPPPCSSSTAGWVRSPPPTTSATSCPPPARSSPGWRTSGVPRIHFGVGTGELLEPDGRGGAEVVGRGLAGAARRGPAACGTRATPSRATSTPPRAWPRGTSSRRRHATCWRAGEGPGTCSTSGHGVLPETDPDVLARVVELVHEHIARAGRPTGRDAVRARGRARHGARHTPLARRAPRLLHRDPTREPATTRAAR